MKEKRVMLITGTRKGIGRYLCEYYLGKGYRVAGCSRKEANIPHSNYLHYNLNVGNEKDVVRMVRDVSSKFETIDILINNAGTASMNHFILTPFKTVQRIMDTNFLGTFLFCREVSKIMLKRKGGRIVNFSTVAVPLKLEGEAVYAASKGAIENMTMTAAKELGEYGITVNAIGPTPIQTDLLKNIPKKKIEELVNKQAIRRYGEYRDVTNVIDFFIDSKSDFITGQVIYLGGV